VDLTALADILVSPHCGILRALEPLPPDVTEPDVPVVRSEVANNRFHLPDQMPFQSCSGKGMTGSQAITGAVGEGCERYGASSWLDDDLTRARPDQLDTAAVLPFELVLFHPDQYAHLPYRPWDPKAELTWVDGFDAASGAPVAVPAVHALLGYAGGSADHLFASTSNGLAAGRTAAQALTAAALEVIERDAYLLSWFHRRPGTRIDPRTLNHPTVATLTEAYQRRMISLELYRLPTDVTAVSVYAAIAVQHSDRAVGRGPAAVVGLGADLEDRDAAAKAVLEIAQVRPALKARMRDPATLARQRELVNDPSRVEHLEDHDLLYGHPEALPWLDFWRQQPPTPWSDPHLASPGSRYERLLRSLADNGHRLIGCNLTPPELGQLGVHVMRATIPNFQPIHFGANEARLGGERLFTCGDGARTVQSELNLLPHPIS
jgi:ribosomal protein S12 methylthiotransferase accessory factor